MNLLVTGAGGFLGRYVVAEAIAAGHDVAAMIRPAGAVPDPSWLGHRRLRIVRADLRGRAGLAEMLAGIDAVLHVAAATSGDSCAQFAGTVVATENLLAAMDKAGVRRIVAVSSLGVYDYCASRLLGTIDEYSPLERQPFARDSYTQAKLAQEKLIRIHAEKSGWDFTIVRPGPIYGPGHLLPARAGMRIGKRTILQLAGWSRLPLVYVENCAAAIVAAAGNPGSPGKVFNLIDDDCPTTRRYVRLLKHKRSPRPRVLPMPWTLLQSASLMANLANALVFRGRAKLPGLLVPARLAARCNPYRYDNRRMKTELGFSPRFTLAEGLARSISGPSTMDELARIGAFSPDSRLAIVAQGDLAAPEACAPDAKLGRKAAA